MLEVGDIDGAYAETPVLRGVSLTVAPGEIVCLLGRNGAGKTTTLRAIMGLVRTTRGHIRPSGVELSKLPAHEVPRQG
jgi:branched-chain amino acid transport system ATP-binding protein